MPEKIGAKPCQRCGVSVQGIQRADRKSLRYPNHCDQCRPLARARRARHPRWRDTWRYVNPHTGYAYVRVERNGKLVRMLEHRAIWESHHGPIPPGLHVHHINHVRLDNRIENLTLLTPHSHNTLHFKITRWAINYDACIQCGTSEIAHTGHGFCERCAGKGHRQRYRALGAPWAQLKRDPNAWSVKYAVCVTCGQTDREHVGRGRCQRCYYREWERSRTPRERPKKGRVLLTEQQRKEMLALRGKMTQRVIAERFGFSQALVSKVFLGLR